MATPLFLLYGIVFVPAITYCEIREHHFINLNLTWTEARTYCREHHTDLATVEREEDLQHMLVPNGVSAWIGLFDDPASWNRYMTTDSNSWRWSATGDRGTSEFMKWDSDQPNFSSAEDSCIVLEALGWNDIRCTMKFKAACYTVTSSVKQFTRSPTEMTWKEARDYCRQHYHDLAVIETLAEYQVLENWYTGPYTGRVWIGLYREPWRWSDNSNSSYKNWESSEPNNENGLEHCVAMGSNLLWRDENCERPMPFICYEVWKQKFFKLKLQSTADLTDLTVNSQIRKAINMKLGVNVTDFKVKRLRLQ